MSTQAVLLQDRPSYAFLHAEGVGSERMLRAVSSVRHKIRAVAGLASRPASDVGTGILSDGSDTAEELQAERLPCGIMLEPQM